MKYVVSYQYKDGPCGNQSFESEKEMNLYIEYNRGLWSSYGTFTFTPNGSGISDLTPIKEKVV